MDEAQFQAAKQAYDAGDFRTAAKGFLSAAGRGAEGNGAAYHMAGNSLMRLRRYCDAVTVYRHAVNDEIYEHRGAVRVNLGQALAAAGEYADAATSFRAGLEEPGYATPYKAFRGLAGALMEMGRIEEAAVAYRQAALDDANPDPGRSLNNLGLCLMALGRPADAAEAYRAALGFDNYRSRGKALSNLGIALGALGQHDEAIKAFERAVELHGHALSRTALGALASSREALGILDREIVEGWSTGEIPPFAEAVQSAEGEREPDRGAPADVTAVLLPVEGQAEAEESAAGVSTADEPSGDQDVESSPFFTMTEQEMREKDKVARRAERTAQRSERNPWVTGATVVLVVVIVVAALAAVYFAGYGFPTQQMTVSGMLKARSEGYAVEKYWVAVPQADVAKEMAKLPPLNSYTVDSVERAARTSRVTVTVTPDDGSPLRYEITLSREGVGWKVSGVANDWRSTSGGS